MQTGMIGLGRMGANMVRRMMQAGHECVVYNRSRGPVDEMVAEGAVGADDLAGLVSKLETPRSIWLMLPAAIVDRVIDDLVPHLSPGDTLIDGGNTWYKDDIARHDRLAEKQLHYLDVGTSGGVWGLERGYCLMIGGEPDIVQRLDPLFAALAPGHGDIERTPGRALRVRVVVNDVAPDLERLVRLVELVVVRRVSAGRCRAHVCRVPCLGLAPVGEAFSVVRTSM